MKLTDYLTLKNIQIGVHAKEKTAIIRDLLKTASAVAPDLDLEEAFTGILHRENIGSTGIGKGVAIPHAGVKNCRRILPVIAISHEGLDYDSLDGKPVNIVFLILYPEDQVSTQLKFLARVSRLLRNERLRESLAKSSSAGEVIGILTQYEAEHFT